MEPDQSRGNSCKVRKLFKKIEKPSNFFSRSHSSNSGDMKRKIKDILARFEDIAKQKDLLDLKKVTLRQKTSQRIPSTSLPDETEVYGRDGNRDIVRKVLLSNDNLSQKICGIPIERDVLDNLLPNTNLKKLKIQEYGGTTFPNWLGNQTLCNLVELSLEHCNFCHTLPPLGELPSLNSLRIGYFDAVVKVGLEFYGCSVKPFASLESLVFDTMSNWKEWLMPFEDVEAFPKLKTLKLDFCGSLNGNLPCFLPSLKELSIVHCSELASSLPKMPLVNTLRLQYCPRLMGLQDIESFSCLQELKIFWNSGPITFRCFPATLKTLRILDCKHLEFPLQHLYESLQELAVRGYSSSSTRQFPVESFPNIRRLRIGEFENLESFSLGGGLNSLSSLDINECPNFTSFPNSSLRFPILTELKLRNCEKLRARLVQDSNLILQI
ncbi:LRR domain containing protein [Trema orientale]|uniref:LRR domain containing protein n=1 Tax=Trema orientale TaxID=63057 RepID=A0A2P5EMZ1_TREOI|nr:LRR domain containing protein [Trema orientale]